MSICRKNIFAFIALFVLILLAYSNTFNASWHFDDENNILNNKPLHLTDFNLDNIKRTFFADWNGSGKLYRPVACLSFALNYYFGQTNVFGYHLVNLVIHFLTAFVLFLFIQATLNLSPLKEKYGTNSYFIALLATLLWAINPVQTQAVTYVVQRMTSMAGMFYISAMYFYVKGRISARPSSSILFFLLTFLSGILALGSKENAVMLPVSILIYDLFLIQGISKHSLKKSFYTLIAITLGCLLIALLLKGPSIFNLLDLPSTYENRGFTLGERLLTEPRVILFYISLLLYPMPQRLCLEHDIPISTGLLNPPFTLIAILIILALIVISLAKAKRWPLISFCVIFFFLKHLIEGTVLPLELTFEHRNYLPSMLIFVPIAVLISEGIRLFSHKKAIQYLIILFVILVLIGWGNSTYIRNKVWKNDGTLSFDCVEKSPDLARPHHNLGRFYAQRGLYQKAINEYLISLEKENPNNLLGKNRTYYNLGVIYQKLGKPDQAMSYYNRAQKYQPHFGPTHIGKGLLYLKQKRYKLAENEFLEALKDKKRHYLALPHLGQLYLLRGQIEDSIASFKAALDAFPQDPNLMRRLGLVYRLTNQPGKALIQFKNALNIGPADPYSLLEISTIYSEKGMKEKLEDTMDQFFNFFKGNVVGLQTFADGLVVNSGSNALLRAHQIALLSFLAQACRESAEKYEALAEHCRLYRSVVDISKGSQQTK